ncbi:MliC family protein [Aeromonas encheleia]|uniref:MliC family protein n=1 Tax=Aeromonas encheleia TaxID=73010 RepID=UPI001F569449|nr:MliC family protein [Aeromonas encheleia]UNP87887.1 MliC family protein [Aeromonas encheleia]
MNKMLLGTLSLMPLLASAATPSFDCAKAHGTTEQLICQDAGLAALDNQLSTLYPKAMSKLSAEQQKTEKAMQRGWIKGRNECWKDTDPRKCIDASYQTRITELQIKGGQLVVPSPVLYQCGDKLRLTTYFYQDAKIPAAVINLDPDQQVLAFGVPVASGTRYEGQNLSLLTKGKDATLERYGEPPLQCQAQGKASAE